MMRYLTSHIGRFSVPHLLSLQFLHLHKEYLKSASFFSFFIVQCDFISLKFLPLKIPHIHHLCHISPILEKLLHTKATEDNILALLLATWTITIHTLA